MLPSIVKAHPGRHFPSHEELQQALTSLKKVQIGHKTALGRLNQKAHQFQAATLDMATRIRTLETARERMQTHVLRVELRISRAILLMKAGGCLLVTLTALAAIYYISHTLKSR